jgi:hypothetical protein
MNAHASDRKSGAFLFPNMKDRINRMNRIELSEFRLLEFC